MNLPVHPLQAQAPEILLIEEKEKGQKVFKSVLQAKGKLIYTVPERPQGL